MTYTRGSGYSFLVLLMMGDVTPETCTSDFAVNKCLHIVASSWTFLLTLNHDARNHELKKKKTDASGWLIYWNI